MNDNKTDNEFERTTACLKNSGTLENHHFLGPPPPPKKSELNMKLYIGKVGKNAVK